MIESITDFYTMYEYQSSILISSNEVHREYILCNLYIERI